MFNIISSSGSKNPDSPSAFVVSRSSLPYLLLRRRSFNTSNGAPGFFIGKDVGGFSVAKTPSDSSILSKTERSISDREEEILQLKTTVRSVEIYSKKNYLHHVGDSIEVKVNKLYLQGSSIPCIEKHYFINSNSETIARFSKKIEQEIYFLEKTKLLINSSIHEDLTCKYTIRMEYRGESLNLCLAKLGFENKIDIAIKIILNAIHLNRNLRILHNDLKLANITYDRETQKVSFIDYADAVELPENSDSASLPYRGTFSIMPPEIMAHLADELCIYNEKTEIFNLGCVLSEILENDTGIPAFLETNFFKKMNHRYVQFIQLSQLISQMKHADPYKRPDYEHILQVLENQEIVIQNQIPLSMNNHCY